ncbi:symplekin isoform X1 [Coffea eugenioides]|uniref:symplekin isoform X1 n=1 Tax=Coffea eugenioides TaxID=49369 RepID=UPI000F60927E|nr:symplekin isoform X1 [Coffea eugenioides]XP_027148565.1 symplekin isoform X1 [Coffea eugenioides]
MAAPPPREQAMALLAAANNHGDLAVKISSLKQAKDILLAAEPFQAAELFPFLVELQSSPESLVRKTLVDVIEDIGLKALEHFSVLMPVLMTFLKDENAMVVKQSIITGTGIFCSVLEELSLQFLRHGTVEMWLEDLWTSMVKFKEAVLDILFEAAPLGIKILTIKFLEVQILLFTPDRNDSERSAGEGIGREGQGFNISWLAGHHPVLDTAMLTSDANRSLGILLDLLRSASNLPGLLTISIVNSLAVIARKRPTNYNPILSALLDFDSKFEMTKGGHIASIQYSIRTAFLGFLRCSDPVMLESRDILLKALRAMNAADAADQALRQVEKMMRINGRASRDSRLSKDEQLSDHSPASVDHGRKRSLCLDNEDPDDNNDVALKRGRYGSNNHVAPSVDKNDSGQDYVNGVSPKVPLLDSNLTAVEQMIAMIGALIAEGERGVESLEILISNIHPDLLADIVITNMRHLPKNPPPLTRPSTSARQGDSSSPSQSVAPVGSTVLVEAPEVAAQVPVSSSNAISSSSFDMSTSNSLPSDSKRDPRRDPRRLDPRRMMASVSVPAASASEDNSNATQTSGLQLHVDSSSPFIKPLSPPGNLSSESILVPMMPKSDAGLSSLETLPTYYVDPVTEEEAEKDGSREVVPDGEEKGALEVPSVPLIDEQELVGQSSSEFTMVDEVYSPPSLEADELSPAISDMEASEDASVELPVLPSYINLTEKQQSNATTLAIERIFGSYKNLRGPGDKQMRMALLARLVAQIDAAADDGIVALLKQLALDYHRQKGHELVLHVLFHLHSLMLSDSEETLPLAAAAYENFLTGVAKSLLESLPATDKSFSRLLGDVPLLTDSVMKLLDDLCCERYLAKDASDDRVSQGLGAVWSLILGRPLNRQACLDIALKCAVHPQDHIRAKAIRLVAKKLYVLGYISESIEQFATRMFLSAIDQRASDVGLSQCGGSEQRAEPEVGSQETSISGSQVSEPGVSEIDSMKGAEIDTQNESAVTLAHAQQHVSLLFALCPKKPSLLRIVFDNYARSPKAIKQAVHRHIPVLIRAFGSSYSQLLEIISDPPTGSENLLTQVISVLSEGTTPPADVIAIVKLLYETKLKDATILIPILSSFSKKEVLPIFPQLVNLPPDKFQTALAHILQGSAHTGPALTPAEVMVAIHDINPERDHLPLKKITDACSVCFEQRTVFTQQVMAKALNQMVDQTPLPLLFMRTVIQTTDAFPALVDFVMELLSKLVSRQVWRMPKLWVGFLKCVSQTQPHSFRVLLQLPSPQLESALNKYAHLRGPLATYASQPSVRNSLTRSTLVLLNLVDEPHLQKSHLTSSLHPPDTSSSLHGAMPT